MGKGRVVCVCGYCWIFGEKEGDFWCKMGFFVRMCLENML